MTDIVERLSVRWEAMGDCAAKKISTIIVERIDALAEIKRLRAALAADTDLLLKGQTACIVLAAKFSDAGATTASVLWNQNADKIDAAIRARTP